MGLYNLGNNKKIAGLFDVRKGKKIKGLIAVSNGEFKIVYRSITITPIEQWQYIISDKPNSMCEFKKENVIFVSAANNLYKLSTDGKLLNKYKTDAGMFGFKNLISTKDGIFVSDGLKIERLNPDTGETIWSLKMGVDTIKSGNDGSIFANISSNSKGPVIYKISSGGKIIWSATVADSDDSASDFDIDSTGKVLVSSRAANGIFEISSDGKEINQIKSGNANHVRISETDDIYIGGAVINKIERDGTIDWSINAPVTSNFFSATDGVIVLDTYEWILTKYDRFGNRVYSYDFSDANLFSR